MDHWNRFALTGDVREYLAYRAEAVSYTHLLVRRMGWPISSEQKKNLSR